MIRNLQVFRNWVSRLMSERGTEPPKTSLVRLLCERGHSTACRSRYVMRRHKLETAAVLEGYNKTDGVWWVVLDGCVRVSAGVG